MTVSCTLLCAVRVGPGVGLRVGRVGVRVVLVDALLAVLFCGLVCGLPRNLCAAEDKSAATLRQASILTRALAYDRNLKQRAGDAVVVGVLFKKGNRSSEAAANEQLAAFHKLESFAVSGLPFRAVRLAYDSIPNLSTATTAEGIDALYVCPGIDGDVEAIATLAADQKLLTFASSESQLGRGLALGVFDVDGKPVISLNLGASRREGAAFSSDLVRLANVID